MQSSKKCVVCLKPCSRFWLHRGHLFEVAGHTYSMEQSPSWEAKWFSARQEIPRILGNQKVHYHIHKCLPPVPILQSISPGPRLSVWIFPNNICLYGEELLPTCPAPKLEDHPLSAVRDCLLNIFAATLHMEGCSSIRNLRMCHALVTGTHLSGKLLAIQHSIFSSITAVSWSITILYSNSELNYEIINTSARLWLTPWMG